MIQNLSTYNIWKRTTLERLTSKYKMEYVRVFKRHAEKLRQQMEHALDVGKEDIHFHIEDIKKDLEHIFYHHQKATIKTGISDGIREMDPSTKLSTWERYPIHTAVEDTFVNLAEKKIRDSIFSRVAKKIERKNKSWISELIDLETKRYLQVIKAVFRTTARSYFTEEKTEDTKDTITDVLKRVFQKTEKQAESVFRTETTRYFNDARLSYFSEDTEVDFVQLVAVTDGRISNICESRDGYVVPIERAGEKQFKPPFHPNCRTVQSPLDTDLKSDVDEVKKNLGSEFGLVHSDTSNQDFKGRRAPPKVLLPNGWR